MSRTAHKWTKIDEERLQSAMHELEPALAHYRAQGYTKVDWWNAVAGKLAPELVVTGKACARRWLTIQGRNETQINSDKWEEVERLVDEYEADFQDAVLEYLDRLDRRVFRLYTELGLTD